MKKKQRKTKRRIVKSGTKKRTTNTDIYGKKPIIEVSVKPVGKYVPPHRRNNTTRKILPRQTTPFANSRAFREPDVSELPIPNFSLPSSPESSPVSSPDSSLVSSPVSSPDSSLESLPDWLYTEDEETWHLNWNNLKPKEHQRIYRILNKLDKRKRKGRR
tara:strand:- start:26 stop:505 length:480 start_codon:yes stop_codon:yes gene_type:complete